MGNKVIPTSYKGYTFRSMLEARWAVYFDSLGVQWEYEHQGYKLSDGRWYLPDFWFPNKWGGIFDYAEVKPPVIYDNETRNKKIDISLYERFGWDNNAIILLDGMPSLHYYNGFIDDPEAGEIDVTYMYDQYIDDDGFFTCCSQTRAEQHGNDLQKFFGQKVKDAVKAARSAKF